MAGIWEPPGGSGGRDNPGGGRDPAGGSTGFTNDYGHAKQGQIYDPSVGRYVYPDQMGQTPSKPTGNPLLGAGRAYDPNTGYDPLFYKVGGIEGMEAEELAYHRDKANAMDKRAMPRTDYQLAMESRQAQGQARELQRQAAMGQAPSVAAIQQQQGLNQAMGMQMSAAASARGGGPSQALAARTAMMQGGDMQQAGVNNAAALRAQEMATARDAYMSGSTTMRGQDTDMAQYLSDMALKNRQVNDSRAMGYETFRENRLTGADAMRIENQKILAESNAGSNGVNAGVDARNAADRRVEDTQARDTTARGIGAAGQIIGSIPMGQSPSAPRPSAGPAYQSGMRSGPNSGRFN